MRQLTAEDRRAIREEVEREFPHDPMMRDLHEIRLARYFGVRDLPLEEQIHRYLDGLQTKLVPSAR